LLIEQKTKITIQLVFILKNKSKNPVKDWPLVFFLQLFLAIFEKLKK